MPPLTICAVWDADYPWDVRVEKVCRSLARDHEVHLVSRNAKRRPIYERAQAFHIHRLPAAPWMPDRLHAALGFPAFFNPVWIRAIRRTVRRSRADVLVVRDIPLALTAVMVGRASRIPVVLDMAENYPAMIEDFRASRLDRRGFRVVRHPRLVRLVERLAIRQADHIVVVVDESRDRLVGMGVPDSKISVVMNTPMLDRRPAQRPKEGVEEGSRPGELLIAYLGVLEVPRGVGTAIRAMAQVRRRLPGARLVVIGAGRDEWRFREEAGRLGVTGSVEFRGWVDYKDALALLAQCDVGLVPHHVTESWQTTMPNKLFDYMSLGKPVIVSNARPTERVVNEERCGLVFPDRDPTALAEAIVAMADPAARAAYGRRGRDAIHRQYNWAVDERRLLGAITQVSTLYGARRVSALTASQTTAQGGKR